MRYSRSVACAVLVVALIAAGAGKEEKQPVYVGARVCGSCHDGAAMGHQFASWRLSKHARAFAVLAKPEAKRMAEISGVPVEPQRSPLCLGCHATAAEAETWEKDATFHTVDGVQCEKCHGPGSEYANDATMRNREAALKAGLRMPTRELCEVCHYVKGSHVAVHKLPKVEIDELWKRLAHPLPEKTTLPRPSSGMAAAPAAAPSASSRAGGARAYTGSEACGGCHTGPQMGYQYSRWRLSPHARAWAVLSTPDAEKLARAAGVQGPAREAAACLKCHQTGGGTATVLASFHRDEGVGCEACHGPGSDYATEAVMRDRPAARAAGVQAATRATCDNCHQSAHGKTFDYDAGLRAIAHATQPAGPQAANGNGAGSGDHPVRYKTPVNLAFRPGGAEVWVACEASGSVMVVDVARREAVADIPVGGQPHDVAFSPDGRRAWVSNRLDDTVSVVDVESRRVTGTVAVGDEPHGLLTDSEGKYLYVANSATEDISVVDTAALREEKRLSASRHPWSLALSPDGRRLLVTNALSRLAPLRQPMVSEATLIDTGRAIVDDRAVVRDANLLLGADWHPGGEFALVTLNRTKNLVPMTRILQGWTITNGLGIVWADGRVDQVLLDEPNQYFADATDVAFTPDGRYALVTSAGTDRVAVVDVARLLDVVRKTPAAARESVLPNHLGKSAEFVVAHIETPRNPRGVAVAPGGKLAFVAGALDDSLGVIDLEKMAPAGRVDLGGPTEITRARRGERLFNSANIAFQRQFSCHSCHPDGHVDGLTYDIEADGIGVSPVDNRTLRGILDTDPFKWEGTNPSLARQCGPRLAVFFTRIQPFTPEELSSVDYYISTIPRPPNRYRPLGASLTPAQRRGKTIFERVMTNDGRTIPLNGRCINCHPAPLFTNRKRLNVGTQMWLDRQGSFDVPHLNNIYDSAPYLHNGAAHTLEEIWTRYNPEDRHGFTNDLTKDQLNDLIEYLKTL